MPTATQELELELDLSKEKKALTVKELTYQIKHQLESSYPIVSVQGEISNFKKQSSGHLYFSLKDTEAQISVALFKGSASKLNFLPKDGDKVVVKGQISVYPPRGSYQLIARSLERVGLGDLLLQLEKLKNELKAKGWFDKERKKPLPFLPKRIGVITSPTGAVIRDIVNVLSHRHSGFELILNPVRVQGSEASKEIALAIKEMNEHQLCEVLIVGRGGGSFEDLMPFNELDLLNAVFESEIPIVSAVGHETDFTLCDFVADLRAPTPSAAAERVLISKKELYDRIASIHNQVTQPLRQRLKYYEGTLQKAKKNKALRDPLSLLLPLFQRVDEYGDLLDQAMSSRLNQEKNRLIQLSKHHQSLRPDREILRTQIKLKGLFERIEARIMEKCRESRLKSTFLSEKLNSSLMNYFSEKNQQLKSFHDRLEALSVQNTLNRGYCAIFDEEAKKPLLSISDLQPNQSLTLRLKDGSAKTTVNAIIKDNLNP